MKIQILLLLAIATAASARSQQSTTSTQSSSSTAAKLQTETVVIKVTNPSGAPVRAAQVRVAPTPDPKPENMQTDQNGQLTLHFEPGRYSLIVTLAGFSLNKSQFDVAPSQAPQTIPVTLQIGRVGGPVMVEPAPDPNVIILSVAPFNDKFRITQETLKGMPRKSVVLHNPHSNADEKYEGVLLADLLTRYGAPLGRELRGGFLSFYVLAVGVDGYRVVYSLAEIDPTFHPGDVIVADTMDGKPLDAHTGPFRLVSTEDRRPARGVRNLIAIEVKSAP